MFEGLASRHAVAVIVDEELCYDLLGVGGHIRDQLGDARPTLRFKVEFHVAGHALELGEKFGGRSAEDVMDLMHLVKFIVSWEQREKGQDFKVDTADSPVVHLMIVVAVGQEALGWPVPSRADILSEGWL